jgi:prepilin-type N-terminal cleavage/methylation domain-containing protein
MSRRPARHVGASNRTGFTLVEVVVAMVILAIVLGGLTSALVVASRSVDAGDGAIAVELETRPVVDEMLADLRTAIAFSERTPSAVTFLVPDRDDPPDGSPETIRYAWTGNAIGTATAGAGDPLIRRYNDGPPVVIVPDVQQFSFSYLLKTIEAGGPPPPPPEEESGELLLVAHDAAPGAQQIEFNLTNSNFAGQFFRPELPLNTVSWSISRVLVRAHKQGSGQGKLYVDVRTATSEELPTDTVLESHWQQVTWLTTSFQWVEFLINTISGLTPGDGLCLVARHDRNGSSVAVEVEKDGSPMTPDAHFVFTTGGPWQVHNSQDRDLRFFVYGTVTTQGTPQWP